MAASYTYLKFISCLWLITLSSLFVHSEFLSDSSHSPINVDSKILDTTRKNMKNPNRYTFDAAQEHIYTLMRSDSYPRFLRSEQYKELLNPKKKVGTMATKTWLEESIILIGYHYASRIHQKIYYVSLKSRLAAIPQLLASSQSW